MQWKARASWVSGVFRAAGEELGADVLERGGRSCLRSREERLAEGPRLLAERALLLGRVRQTSDIEIDVVADSIVVGVRARDGSGPVQDRRLPGAFELSED